MRDDNGRNTIIFVVVTAIFLIAYQALVLGPQAERRKAALQAQREAAASTAVTPLLSSAHPETCRSPVACASAAGVSSAPNGAIAPSSHAASAATVP
ncbi:MAG: hypothetical protein KJ954_05905 [Alphaproteobacteria bacterium]|nr:hypothetical protein [Alphaproteobacteria bacterium]